MCKDCGSTSLTHTFQQDSWRIQLLRKAAVHSDRAQGLRRGRAWFVPTFCGNTWPPCRFLCSREKPPSPLLLSSRFGQRFVLPTPPNQCAAFSASLFSGRMSTFQSMGGYERFIGLLASWVLPLSDVGPSSQTLVAGNFRRVVLDKTAVTTWTVARLLLQRELVSQSISGCRKVLFHVLAELLELREPQPNYMGPLPPVESTELRLCVLQPECTNYSPEELPEFDARIPLLTAQRMQRLTCFQIS
ncbi:hypothetical protein M427DRAFT_61297 [Gonapodya prolifera JEL478]|uniref:Uncharacterized protein n=1 Tax=Gonapodya prolifera (strain JEL478) TaxID=1344416 RepID=A0A139A2E3_GONPJ|nr:hypothetical protein M427DRAFT_61297 [Gonapodya prolifera JEL478]|eukprot:KXS10932.1 hypothetical protein M427DRAFT_61297 [Gonapodya prolifera JEL478]